MNFKDKFIEFQRFLEMHVIEGVTTTNSEEQQKYYEMMHFHYLGMQIASLKDGLPFYAYNNHGVDRPGITKLGHHILRSFTFVDNNRIFGDDDSYFYYFNLSPQLRRIYQAFLAARMPEGSTVDGVGFVEPVQVSERFYKYLRNNNLHVFNERLNSFVLQLRKALRSQAIREQVKSFERNSKERYMQLKRVASQAWARHCKNLLLRVDWSFKKEHSFMPVRFQTPEAMEQTFERVNQVKEASLKRLKARFGKDLIFYAWKIECGYYKGLHIHWLIAVNGAKYKNGWYTAQEITDDWNTHICGHDSYALNVNGLDRKEKSGLGMIDYRDPHLADTLDRYAAYLTKTDLAMKLRAPGNMRTFGCSKLTKEPETKRGPKRSGRIAVSNA
jgi:hypothetical protein